MSLTNSKKLERYAVYALGVFTFAWLQRRRWNHAKLMQRHGGFNVIGYQIPGGLYVAKAKTSDVDSAQRFFIDLKCQVYTRDERLSSFDPTPYWFDVARAVTVKYEKRDQAKPAS